MKSVLKILILCGLFFTASTFAAGHGMAFNERQGTGIGAVASNLLAPIGGLRKAMDAASILLGIYLLMSAFTRYLRFRENPQESHLSTVFLWIFLGILLISIPGLHYLSVLAAEKSGVTHAIP